MRCQVQEQPEQPSILHGGSLKKKRGSHMPSHVSVQGRRNKRKEGKLKFVTDTDQTTRPGVGSDLKAAFASSFSFFWPSWNRTRRHPFAHSSCLLLTTHAARMAADRRRRRTTRGLPSKRLSRPSQRETHWQEKSAKTALALWFEG